MFYEVFIIIILSILHVIYNFLFLCSVIYIFLIAFYAQ
jgi:hypothetical protein